MRNNEPVLLADRFSVSKFGRVLYRLARMLKADEEHLTGELLTGPITQVIDPFQGGAAVAQYLDAEVVVPASTGAGTIALTSSSENSQGQLFGDNQLVKVLVIDVEIAGATKNLQFHMTNQVGGRSFMRRSYNFPAGRTEWHTIAGQSDGTWLIPPGYSLNIVHPATGVGESITIRALLAVTPVGFSYLNP